LIFGETIENATERLSLKEEHRSTRHSLQKNLSSFSTLIFLISEEIGISLNEREMKENEGIRINMNESKQKKLIENEMNPKYSIM
jgi:hypothetical protein